MDDKQIDAMLDQLDSIARGRCNYDYGLPLGDPDYAEAMREAVREAIRAASLPSSQGGGQNV